ncbi:sigma-70 family RNA polymerase sigma factor [Prosthecobacter sp.]|uniref:RNA polymerase sigma factor n=1 Tax=Prosthecobacter sp. TaxID=1965333 RepID=UPI001E14275B|nr:sigma-70 family RNA polymerase sigma factor [Prosthecobacter sp.]MCB1278424.1 sigma-70 family RNA polymerase sigma factor [Prosthecobacter sp.]
MSQPGERSPTLVADDLFRREGARLVASLAAHLGTHRLQLAEDVVQEALVRALQTWPYRGIPENPAAWLTQAAKNLALDALRREKTWQRKEAQITAEQERWLTRDEEPANEHDLSDDTLRMLFVCFHPQLSVEAQLALALRTVCGLSPAEIGAAFLISEAAIAKRLVRTRQLIRDLRLPFAVPPAGELPQRLDGVLGVLYLLFNEGYKASSGDRLVREELCHEAIRLTRLLSAHSVTSRPATQALLALMCLNAARLRARLSATGEIVRLQHQDRSQWNADLIQEGILALGAASTGDVISAYHLEAGIAACHCLAESDATTDWSRILSLYDQLLLLKPTPIVAMNRSVALARVRSPHVGLEALESIPNRHSLEAHHLYHAIRASFMSKLGQPAEARAAYLRAAELAPCDAEREFLQAQSREQDA